MSLSRPSTTHTKPPNTSQLSSPSRWLHIIDYYTSLPAATLIGLVVIITALLVGVALRFSSAWVTAFTVAAASVTVLMVLVIQHTQSRQQQSLQHKLDELLLAMPEAATELIMLEEESAETIPHIEAGHRESKELTRQHS